MRKLAIAVLVLGVESCANTAPAWELELNVAPPVYVQPQQQYYVPQQFQPQYAPPAIPQPCYYQPCYAPVPQYVPNYNWQRHEQHEYWEHHRRYDD